MQNSICVHESGNNRAAYFNNGEKRLEKIFKGIILEIGEVNIHNENYDEDYFLAKVDLGNNTLENVVLWGELYDPMDLYFYSPNLFQKGMKVDVAIILEGRNKGKGYISPEGFYIKYKKLFGYWIAKFKRLFFL